MIIGGIDPGKKGAIVLLDTQSNFAYKQKFSFVDKDLDYVRIHQILLSYSPGLIVIEKVQGRVGPSATSTFQFGYTFGQMVLGLRLSKVPYRQIVPSVWQKVMHQGVTGNLTPKEKSMVAYTQLFPHAPIEPNKRNGKVNLDLIDALLIATYGVMTFGDHRAIRPWRFAK